MASLVLVVDDSPLARAAAERLLSGRGIPVRLAGSREEVAALDAGTLAAALLDLEVGPDRGTDIAELLRERARELPVAFLTAADDSELLDRARALGPVFSKGAELDRALGWLDQVLGRRTDGRS